MAQNITTLLDKTEITAADIRVLESTVDNFLYLVHGTGSNRDKKFNLKQLRVWLSVLTELTLMKAFTGGHSTVELDGESINLSAEGTAVTDNSRLEISRQEIKFTRNVNGNNLIVSITPGGIEISSTNIVSETTESRLTNDKLETPSFEAGRAVINGSKIEKSQYIQLNNNDDHPDLNGGPIIEYGNYTQGFNEATIDLVNYELPNAVENQRFTICNYISDKTLYVKYGVQGYKWKLEGCLGCDFIVRSTNPLIFIPVGAGERVVDQ